MIIPDDERAVMSFVRMWSRRVADECVTIVGFKICGRNPLENIPSTYTSVGSWEPYYSIKVNAVL